MKMLLNGKKVGTEGREEIIVINPYTHEEIDSVPCADLNDIDTALECAREGAEKWGRVPVLERVRILEKVSSKIAEKKKGYCASPFKRGRENLYAGRGGS